MNHSSLQLPAGPEPVRPRSAFASAIVLVGVCSALFLTAPVLIRSLRALFAARASGYWMPLLEVGLALLGVLALSSVVVGVGADLRSRLSSGRRRWRRHRRPWEEFLMESEAEDVEPSLGDFPRLTRPQQTQVTPVKNRRSTATLRLVEATPWPLGSNHSAPAARNHGKIAPVTKLGFAASRPLPGAAPCTPAWQEPAFQTPYPYSVWSFHDNRPDDIVELYQEDRPTRSWLWATLLFAGAALAAMAWWRLYGHSTPFSV